MMAEDQDIIKARQARELAKKLAEQRAAATSSNPLADLQAGIASSKAQVQSKNTEIASVALDKAANAYVNSPSGEGNFDAVKAAAAALGKSQGLSGGELAKFAYQTAQGAIKEGVRPPVPAEDAFNKYDYVWHVFPGGGGEWRLVSFQKPNLAGGTGGTGGGGNAGGSAGGGGTGGGGTTYTAPDGKIFTDLSAYNAYIAQTNQEAKTRAGKSAYDLLFSEFEKYGLGALVDPLKSFITEGLSQAEFTLRLRETDAYKKRFAANAQRIAQGLRALGEAEYILLEDKYQDVMKRYGLTESYYKRGEMGRQEGFEKFIAGDVSAPELEDRIQTAYNRVINAAPEVSQTLRSFYPEISDGDILAYALDPSKAIENIKRKVTAAEIGGAATQAGLATGLSRAEELQRYGVTGESARQGFQTIAGYLPRATTLGDIYAKQGMGPFTQTTAEAEVFGTPGAAEAAAKRRKLSELEQAQFGGSAGVSGGALGRERAGQF